VRGTYTWPERWPVEDALPGKIESVPPSIRTASLFVIAMRMLFLYERGDALVLGPSLPKAWLDLQDTLGVRNAPTYFGTVSYTLKTEKRISQLLLDTSAAPPRGFALVPPVPSLAPKVKMDGVPFRGDLNFERKREITLLPGTLSVEVDW
jgi:hypothetical protein